MSKETKPYGLIMPKKAQLSAPRAGNIFGDDNDSDPDDGVDWVKKALKAESEKHKVKKQTRLNMKKALNEDPTIYQYDEVYEEMGKAKEQSKPVKEEKKKPKYIHSLLKAAEKRKMEQEHRLERMVQKEREAEGEMYADKESFVTSAYRAKLEQFRKIEEEEERMDRLEAIADVTKQPDMSGFHRHLFAQTFDAGKTAETPEENSPDGQKSGSQSPNIDRDEELSSDSSESQSDSDDDSSRKDKNQEKSKITSKGRGNRQYRKRVVEESESESEEEAHENSDNDATKEMTAANSPERRKTEEQHESPRKKPKLSDPEEKEKNSADGKKESPEVFTAPDSKNEKENKDVEKEESKEEEKPEEKKPSIWEKRTVGPVFEAALERYYARKAMRVSGS